MTCHDVTEFLSGWLDGELDMVRARALSAHLAACDPCRAMRDAWAGQSRALRAVGRRTPPPPSWEDLAARLREAPAARRIGARPFGFRIAASAAATLLLATVGFLALRDSGPSAPHPDLHGVSDEIMRQLVDAGVRPDLSPLGAVTRVGWDRFASLSRDARFAPVAPASLPGGYAFSEGWVIDSETCRMICARYLKEGRVVAILQSESSGAPICTLANPQCCRIAGLICRRGRIDRVEVVQATRGRVALTVAARAGETDIDAVVAALNKAPGARAD